MSDVEYNERMEHAKELSNSVSNQDYEYSDKLMNILKEQNAIATESAPKKYVYVTENGAKYHEYGCSTIKSTPHKLELTTAIDRGYAPCKVCNPYDFASAEIAEEKAEKKEITTKVIIIISICVLLLVVYIVFNEKRYKR